jgi:hypothetical protein
MKTVRTPFDVGKRLFSKFRNSQMVSPLVFSSKIVKEILPVQPSKWHGIVQDHRIITV